MKQRLLIGGVLLLLVAAMIGLNALTYVQKDKIPDSELDPNRSSYNGGATGSKALFDLLNETGRRVIRWQEPPSRLLKDPEAGPATFVLVGPLRRKMEEKDTRDLLNWVSGGGRLVLIDRDPPAELLVTTADWKVRLSKRNAAQIAGVDPADRVQMTSGAAAARPSQPTLYSRGVTAIQPSRFASDVVLERADYTIESDAALSDAWFSSPIVHFTAPDANFMVEMPYGAGRIVVLSDPFFVANSGIALADNARMAINILDAGGQIAFDEYHQGFGSGRNRMLAYFSGTPVVSIFLQLCVIAVLAFYSKSRRFARPVPEAEPDRLSKLEYVAAMGELQRRTRAYDLALDNIYSEFRRRTAQLLGADGSSAGRADLARSIAQRIGGNASEIEDLLERSEAVAQGGPADRRTVLGLVEKLRELESKLGLDRRRRGPG